MIALLRRLLRLDLILDMTQANEAGAFLGAPPAPMQEIRPSQASNDDPLRILHEAVERELRVAGLIR